MKKQITTTDAKNDQKMVRENSGNGYRVKTNMARKFRFLHKLISLKIHISNKFKIFTM